MKKKQSKKSSPTAWKKVEKVFKVGLQREEGWLYFIDADGDISRIPIL